MSNGKDENRLFNLMPTVYRERDEQEGFPLRDLLRLVTEQADIVHADIQLLWDNFFIETCERWAIPYIGDLVSNNLLNDAQNLLAPDTARELFPDLIGPNLRPTNAIRIRADVAKTIYYRRRKGTLPMLEEFARDVTGWGSHAVEFFELLIWNQNLNHLRMHSTGCPELRSPEAIDRLNTAFDFMSHTIDVRYPVQEEGWHNIRNIGFFLWRLRSYLLENAVARQGTQPWQFYFSQLGNPAPLFSRFRREGDEAGLATEFHVPGPIRPAAFFKDPDEFYGLTTTDSFVIIRDGVPVPAGQIRCRNLDVWTQPSGNLVGVDVRNGRIAFGPAFVPATSVDVNYHYGFSGDVGGGPYQRGKWLVGEDAPDLFLIVREGGPVGTFPTLIAALQEWVNQTRPNAVIRIDDNRSYALDPTLELADDRFLVIQANDGVRPHILADGQELEISGDHPGSQLTLSGLLFEGGVHVTGEIGKLRLVHTTLVPGRGLNEDGTPASLLPSVIVEEVNPAGADINEPFRLQVAFSITGPLRLPPEADSVVLLDSIVDGLGGTAISATNSNTDPGPPGTLERVTILGPSFFRKLPLASEVIFTGRVIVEQTQEGCVRFSSVHRLSITPRRYRCQPDLEIAKEIEQAEKTCASYGGPAGGNYRASGCSHGAVIHLNSLRRPRLRTTPSALSRGN